MATRWSTNQAAWTVGQSASQGNPIPGFQDTYWDLVLGGTVQVVNDPKGIKGKVLKHTLPANAGSASHSQRAEIEPAYSNTLNIGGVQWVGFDLDASSAYSSTPYWRLFYQAKNDGTGSPPVAMNILANGQAEVNFNEMRQWGPVTGDINHFSGKPTGWCRWAIGIKADRTNGWVEVWKDDGSGPVQVFHKDGWVAYNSTSDAGQLNGSTIYQQRSSIYNKFGGYRGATGTTDILYSTNYIIADTRDEVISGATGGGGNVGTPSFTNIAVSSTPTVGQPTTFTPTVAPSSGKTLTKVDYFSDGNPIGTATGAPWSISFPYQNPHASPGAQVTATATQNDGGTKSFGPIGVIVAAAAAAAPPNAVATATWAGSPASTPTTATAITFSSASSTIAGGHTATSAWLFDNATTATGSSTSKTFTTPGTHPVRLTVTQDDGQVDTFDMTVTVVPAPLAPPTIAAIDLLTLAPHRIATKSLAFNIVASPASGATITSISVDFGDGNMGSGSQPFHTYASANTYTVKAIATQSDGQASQAVSKQFVIAAPPTIDPVALTITDLGGHQYQLDWDATTSGGLTGAPYHVLSAAGGTPSTTLLTTQSQTAVVTGIPAVTNFAIQVENEDGILSVISNVVSAPADPTAAAASPTQAFEKLTESPDLTYLTSPNIVFPNTDSQQSESLKRAANQLSVRYGVNVDIPFNDPSS